MAVTEYIIGLDEVGLGAWAGPLVVCAVAVPRLWTPPDGLNDSKKLTPAMRTAVYFKLRGLIETRAVALFAVENKDIDRVGLRRALVDAHTSVIESLLERFPADDIIVDGNVPLPKVPKAKCIPKADGLYPSVMAASVIAKYNRDVLMQTYHEQYPHYGWDSNAGYGTEKHQKGLQAHGVSPLHRQSFAPIKGFLRSDGKSHEARNWLPYPRTGR